MRQMAERLFFNARVFLPALFANVMDRWMMTLAFGDQMHSIRGAYLHQVSHTPAS